MLLAIPIIHTYLSFIHPVHPSIHPSIHPYHPYLPAHNVPSPRTPRTPRNPQHSYLEYFLISSHFYNVTLPPSILPYHTTLSIHSSSSTHQEPHPHIIDHSSSIPKKINKKKSPPSTHILTYDTELFGNPEMPFCKDPVSHIHGLLLLDSSLHSRIWIRDKRIMACLM